MKKYRIFTFLIALTLVLPAIFGASKVLAANPSFTIGEVLTDESVTILVKDAPKNREFVVRMGEYDTKGINGIEAGRFSTGEGGSLQATLPIPQALKGRAQIAIRMDSVTGGWYYYNWFWNDKENGTWPAPSQPVTTQTPPAATQPAPKNKIVPMITIKQAVESVSVTIQASNFPKNAEIKAFMGKMYTRGMKGIEVGTLTSSDTGAFEATFQVPETLANEERVAIRLESVSGGWYAYNWFWNKQGGNVVQPPASSIAPDPADSNAEYPLIFVSAVNPGSTVTINAQNLRPNTEYTVLLGKNRTRGINGIASATFTTQDQTDVVLTVDIPAELASEDIIAIRIESPNGFYAYNWFFN